MPTLLRIDVSPRGDYSFSRQLANAATAAWHEKYADGKVVTRDVSQDNLPFVDLPWIGAAYSTPDQHTPEQMSAIKVSDDLIDELLAADHILIATPMYNFGVPAALKSWIDHIVRLGKTFTASYEGLAKGKKVAVIMTSGSNFEAGSRMESYDFLSPYLPIVFGFIGITDVTVYKAGDTTAVAQGKQTMDQYLAAHTPAAVAALVA